MNDEYMRAKRAENDARQHFMRVSHLLYSGNQTARDYAFVANRDWLRAQRIRLAMETDYD